MRVLNLSIRNFRGIRQADLRLRRHNVFVGANNAGKTTVLEALALLFGRDRLVRNLTEHDFYGSSPGAQARIRLIATVIDFPGNEPTRNSNWFHPERAVPLWIDRKTGKTLAEPGDDSVLACQIGFAARFDRAMLEVETARYFVDHEDHDVFAEDSYHAVPGRLLRELGFFFVPASRTWDRALSFSSELFRRVVTTGSGMPAQAVLSERDRLRTPESPVETDQQLSPIIESINEELGEVLAQSPQLKLRVTATDSEAVLESLVAHYAGADGPALPVRRHGSGLVSLQTLLLLLQLGNRRAANNESFWLAMEEPELHLPPPVQRRIVSRLQALSGQTFITSHSPTVGAMSDPQMVTVLHNQGGVLTGTRLMTAKSKQEDINAVRRLFELHRIETITALMHDAVLIPEGATDFQVLRLLESALASASPKAGTRSLGAPRGLGIIRTGDAAVVATYDRLRHLHPRVTCLVDGDAPGARYTKELLGLEQSAAVLRWPQNWTLEDVLGWIVEGEPALLGQLEFEPAVSTVPELVARLKSDDRRAGGLKQDNVSYELLVEAIARSQGACSRAHKLLDALSKEAAGTASDLFSGTGQPTGVRVFSL